LSKHPNIHLVSEEVELVLSKTKLVLPMLCALADMCLKPVPTHQQNKISQDGLYLKLADPTRMQEDLTETRPMTLGHPLASRLIQKTRQLVKLTLAQQAEKLLKD
jgi:hypothetical protein